MNLFGKWFGRRKALVPVPPRTEGVEEGSLAAFGGCGHPGPRENLKIRVFGYPATVFKSPLCTECTEICMNECSTHCAGCDYPILPGQQVAAAWVGAPHPYTHMSQKCGNPDFYTGVWGAGYLIGLEEMHPDIFSPTFMEKLMLDRS